MQIGELIIATNRESGEVLTGASPLFLFSSFPHFLISSFTSFYIGKIQKKDNNMGKGRKNDASISFFRIFANANELTT